MSLSGLNVIEFAGLAPGPFAGLVLADNGASVTRVDRPSSVSTDVLCRGKRSIAINPKIPSGREALKKLISSADVVIDPFRPGVMERLGLGPQVFLGEEGKKGLNEKIIYARIVGFPRTGPHKDMAGHDINYIALSGALAMLPGPDKPRFPLNLLADFAGGGLICVLGILLALIERGKSGRGQVVNADMVSGAQYVAAFPLLHALIPNSPLFGNGRENNTLDGGAPFYDVYTCKDGGWMSVGCLEPQFFREFITHFSAGLPQDFAFSHGWRPSGNTQTDRDEWPKLKEYLQKGFLTNTRDYWARIFHGTDACALPVLSPVEVHASANLGRSFPTAHPQVFGSRSLGVQNKVATEIVLTAGTHTQDILEEMKLTGEEKRQLVLDGALGEHERISVSTRSHKL
ncbi:CoA-transferase family III [Collybia nuda]|uniref:CoA-transferase family III n=1 Tax=Collybia nuda TaxID=64659 RepID=A0A9P5YDV2_9AGAR|nr:CoA-transferase family III [Collybia nuda]